MKFKPIDTFEDKNEYLAFRVRKPNPKYLINMLNSIDEFVEKFGCYKVECFGQSYNYSDAFIFNTNIPYSVYIEKKDSVD